MRKLGLQDVFALSRILDKLDLKLDLQGFIDEARDSEDAISYVGGQITLTLMRSLYKVDNEVYAWLASLTGQTEEDVKNLGIKDLQEIFTNIFSDEDIVDFFGSLGLKEQTSNILS